MRVCGKIAPVSDVYVRQPETYPGPAEVMCGSKLEPSPRPGDTADREPCIDLHYYCRCVFDLFQWLFKSAVKQATGYKSCLASASDFNKVKLLSLCSFLGDCPCPSRRLPTHIGFSTLECLLLLVREVGLVHTFSSQP
jgi:hypothetical protein